MAKKITQEMLEDINRLYNELGTYSAVAKVTGISASTISKYMKQQDTEKSFSDSTIVPCPIERISRFIHKFKYLSENDIADYKAFIKEYF